MTVDPVTGLAKPWLDGWRGAIWIHAMAAVPWVVCMVAAGLARVPAAMEEAASLVASPCRVLWSITLPAVRPAIAIATVWTMVSVAAEMTVTDFFQIRTFAEEVYTTAAAGGFQTDNPAADYAAWVPWTRNLGLMAGVGLLASLSLLVLLPVVHQLKTAADVPAQRTWRWECRGWRRWLAMLVPMSVLLLAAGMPIASLVHKAGWGAQASGTGWQRTWSLTKLQSELAGAVGLHARELWQTLVLAIAVATGAMVLGLVIGWHLPHQSPHAHRNDRGAGPGAGDPWPTSESGGDRFAQSSARLPCGAAHPSVRSDPTGAMAGANDSNHAMGRAGDRRRFCPGAQRADRCCQGRRSRNLANAATGRATNQRVDGYGGMAPCRSALGGRVGGHGAGDAARPTDAYHPLVLFVALWRGGSRGGYLACVSRRHCDGGCDCRSPGRQWQTAARGRDIIRANKSHPASELGLLPRRHHESGVWR